MNNKTAILIFAHSAIKEPKQIPKSALLFNALNLDIINKVKKTNQPYFIYNENNQEGNSFGEKLTNAIQEVLNKGFDHVITVGNDTPELQTSNLNTAINNASKNKLTFGPSKDGGFYLMTFNKKSFKKEQYKFLSWQNSLLFTEVITLIKQPIVLLSYLQDIDTYNDLNFINLNRISNVLRNIISDILYITKLRLNTSCFFHNTPYKSNFYNKGSPLA